MCITRYARHTLHAEIERIDRVPGFLEEGHDETTETTIDVHADLVLMRKLAKGGDVVHVSVWKVYRGANKLRAIRMRWKRMRGEREEVRTMMVLGLLMSASENW
jgi:hypothetical protein